jgi:hypothetical protein
MPRLLIRAKDHDRNRSLGWLATAWMEHFVVHGPGDVLGEPVTHSDEYTGFIVDCYAVDHAGRRLYDGAFWSRPKGTDKSGMAARFDLFEAFGPCRGTGEFAEGGEVYRDPYGLGFEYIYEPGEPIGRHVRTPVIRCMATEEDQTGNVYDSVHYNLTDGPLAGALERRDDAGLTRILIPGGGEIIPSTASSAAKDGGKETHASYDETHLYTKPELRRMYQTVNRNLRKRKKIAETWYLETTTMFADGERSIAEDTYKVAELIAEGKTRRERLLLDHRWGEIEPEDLADEKKLRAAIVEAYGDAIEWNDLDGIVNEFYDPKAEIADSVRYFLNAKHAAADAWLNPPEWAGCADPTKRIADRDVITLGFDGSRGRARGKPDATALIGCRVHDGHLFELGIWEAGDKDWDTWTPPIVEIEAAIRTAFTKYTVAGFYADPAKDWRSFINAWEAEYGAKVAVKARRDHPFEWWMTDGAAAKVQTAIEDLEGAIRNRDCTHAAEHGLTRHMLNARRRLGRGKLKLGKPHDYSPNKIDAAVAAVLAWQARLAVLAAGGGAQQPQRTSSRVRRVNKKSLARRIRD